jgi:hypothetical protein
MTPTRRLNRSKRKPTMIAFTTTTTTMPMPTNRPRQPRRLPQPLNIHMMTMMTTMILTLMTNLNTTWLAPLPCQPRRPPTTTTTLSHPLPHHLRLPHHLLLRRRLLPRQLPRLRFRGRNRWPPRWPPPNSRPPSNNTTTININNNTQVTRAKLPICSIRTRSRGRAPRSSSSAPDRSRAPSRPRSSPRSAPSPSPLRSTPPVWRARAPTWRSSPRAARRSSPTPPASPRLSPPPSLPPPRRYPVVVLLLLVVVLLPALPLSVTWTRRRSCRTATRRRPAAAAAAAPLIRRASRRAASSESQLDELRRRRTKATRALQQRLYDPANRVDTQPVLVWFLDDKCEQLDVSLDITALDLLYLLADQVRFEWPELFALCEVELSGAEPRWLPMDRPLRALGLDLAQSQRRLQCRLKYERRAIDRVYKDARLLRFADAAGAREHSRRSLAVSRAGRRAARRRTRCRPTFGDYDTALHRAGYVALGGLEQFLPLPLLTNRQESDQYWEERLTSLHQQHRGLLGRRGARALPRRVPPLGAAVWLAPLCQDDAVNGGRQRRRSRVSRRRALSLLRV